MQRKRPNALGTFLNAGGPVDVQGDANSFAIGGDVATGATAIDPHGLRILFTLAEANNGLTLTELQESTKLGESDLIGALGVGLKGQLVTSTSGSRYVITRLGIEAMQRERTRLLSF